MDRYNMKFTPEEQETFDWCRLALTEEQIVDCEEQASELAGAELHQEEAAELFVKLLAKVIIRNVRAEQAGSRRPAVR
jgi:hypothetical protein